MTPHLPAVETPQGFGFNPYRAHRDRHHQGIVVWPPGRGMGRGAKLLGLCCPAPPGPPQARCLGVAWTGTALTGMAPAGTGTLWSGTARHCIDRQEPARHRTAQHRQGLDLARTSPSPSPQPSAPAHAAGGALPGPVRWCLEPLAWRQGGCPVVLAATCYPG